MGILDKILRAGEGKKLKALQGLVPDVNALEPEYQALSDDALRGKTDEFRQRLANGATLDDLLIEAFAITREAARRVIGQRHYDVQLMGGAALHFGWIAEMKTGEGKTLVVHPAGLPERALRPRRAPRHGERLPGPRDAEWMGRIHRWLGLSVGLVIPGFREDPASKRESYGCDITYGTNNEFGFDYLRDNMATSLEAKVQRGHVFAIVDEVDSILIDEARTPLIISGRVADAAKLYYKFASIARSLKRDVDYEVDEEKRTVAPARGGHREGREGARPREPLRRGAAEPRAPAGRRAEGQGALPRDKDYIVQNGEVKIVDEFTGRILEGRRWSEGIHQAVEAKEGVKIKEENQTLATITLQNYFRMYEKLAGMTGTAATEAAELMNTYDLQVVPIPTNKPIVRLDEPDLIYKAEPGKFERRGRGHRRAPREGPAGPGRHHLGGQERAPLAPAATSAASPTRCSTRSSTPVRPASWPRPAGSAPSRWPPTWPAEASTSSSAATPRASPARRSCARASRPSARRRVRAPDAARPDARGVPQRPGRGPGRYDELLEKFNERVQGRGRQGPRARWALRARHRAPREPPHRQPAAWPRRPPGRPGREPLLPLARRRADAPVRHRRHELGDGQGPPRRRADRGEDGHQGHRAGPDHRRAAQRRDPQERPQVRRGDERAAQGHLQAPRPDPRGRRPARRALEYLADAVDSTIEHLLRGRGRRGVGPRGPAGRARRATTRPTLTVEQLEHVRRSTDELYDLVMAEATAYYERREAELGPERDARGRAPGDAAHHRPALARAPLRDGLPAGGHQPAGHGPEGPARRVAARGLRRCSAS